MIRPERHHEQGWLAGWLGVALILGSPILGEVAAWLLMQALGWPAWTP